MDRPDRKGRARILEVHTRGKPLAKTIALDDLAGQTPGFTGADLANLVNEAALLAAREGKREISQHELEEGIMRVIAGPEKKTRVMGRRSGSSPPITRWATRSSPTSFRTPTRCTRSRSSRAARRSVTRSPCRPRTSSSTTRAELADTLAMTLGGRAAEEIAFSEITTGAANDLEKVTATAKQMVMRFGMSEKLGPRTFGHDQTLPFLGREFNAEPDYSDEIAREIDDEIRRIVEEAHQTARAVLSERQEHLDRLSRLLLEHETLEREQFEALLAGKSEEEVFGAPEPEKEPPTSPAEPERSRPVTEPRPLPHPRPGLAGGRQRCVRRVRNAASSESAVGSRPSAVTDFARPAVMGVLNVTPDSFSDGGSFSSRGRRLLMRSGWRRMGLT